MSQQFSRSARACVPVMALLIVNVCGGKSTNDPTPLPTPVANPSPTPSPTPTPDPPLSSTCERLGAGSSEPRCTTVEAGAFPTYQAEVDEAIEATRQRRPDIFDGNVVLAAGVYYVEIIKRLDEVGLCAHFDGQELGVKGDDTFNDQYHILTTASRVRKGPPSFRAFCRPASFPLPQAPRPSTPGCPLPPSREVHCARDPRGGQFYEDVALATRELMETKPDWFDFTDQNHGLPRINNVEEYAGGLVEILTRSDYCARFDGHELQVKRGSNEFSEQYAVTLSLTWVRNDPNSYRATCNPATF
jgi:hypothetical protein